MEETGQNHTKMVYDDFQIWPTVTLCNISKNIETNIVHDARVSAPPERRNDDPQKLLCYLLKHGHWSPFEMEHVKFEIICPRDVSRQILRHRSLIPQEFSQRYSDPTNPRQKLKPFLRVARMQHPTNRQSSVPTRNEELHEWWEEQQIKTWKEATKLYHEAIGKGIAKEVARSILPEGMTPTRMRITGNVRDWLFFCQTRGGEDTQLETQHVAREIINHFWTHIPTISNAFWHDGQEF